MRTVLIASLLLAACSNDGADPGPDAAALACPDQAVSCGVRDGGWNARCASGAVEVQDLTQTLYCAPGTTEVLCESPIHDWQVVLTCSNGCATDQPSYFETVDEYQRFAPATLCN
jgi:hypothetical protein